MMMKKYLFLLIGLSFLFSCAAKKNVITDNYSGGDGSSFENAVIINETGESRGVADEYAWIKAHYRASTSNGQALLYNNNKPYDVLQITTADEKAISIYFDISKFYGKLQ